MEIGLFWFLFVLIFSFAVVYFSMLSPLIKMAKEADKNQAKQQ